MSRRTEELNRFSARLSWLSEEDAALVFTRANKALSQNRYGLDENTWEILEHWDVEKLGLPATREKLDAHVRDESFLICFGRKDVCRAGRTFFLDHWQDMFVPSRDDILVISESGTWAAFYWHEDEFEVGRPRIKIEASKAAVDSL